jgi:hypothetical protein
MAAPTQADAEPAEAGRTRVSGHLIDGVVGEFPVTEQVGGVLADLFRTELVGWPVEVARQVLDDSQVGACGTFSVIATREFLERHFS